MMDEEAENYYHNPALNPTRHWEDAPEVEDELRLMIAGISTESVRLLENILNAGSAALGREEDAVEFLNETARTFGFRPLR